MSYVPTSEKIPVAPMSMPRPVSVEDYRENSQIRRARRVLIVVLSIQLAFAVLYLIHRTVYLVQYSDLPEEVREKHGSGSYVAGLVWAIISVIYIVIFFLVVLQYVRIGILIFVWVALIQLVAAAVLVGIAVIGVIASTALTHYFFNGVIVSILIIIAAALYSILTILTVYFGFQMAKLLKQHENYQLV